METADTNAHTEATANVLICRKHFVRKAIKMRFWHKRHNMEGDKKAKPRKRFYTVFLYVVAPNMIHFH